uniref:Death on curing protein n=1 Tax=Candidatus Kentrum sp. LPFa TaxID=2126335 RepID=A0A450X4S4_9GAMM|nr:MAG: death on curing protein [Candidatus Kentron sp. LPFa]
MNLNTPKWISKKQAIYIHDLSIKKHGGIAGIRDEGLLDSALNRPLNHFTYGERSLYALTAIYAQGISKNHAFLDGNKRTAYSVAALFLHFNGLSLKISSIEKQIAFFMDLAAGKVSREELTLFYQNNT